MADGNPNIGESEDSEKDGPGVKLHDQLAASGSVFFNDPLFSGLPRQSNRQRLAGL
jgi:hypothetical protein